jgi:hypothetical protein
VANQELFEYWKKYAKKKEFFGRVENIKLQKYSLIEVHLYCFRLYTEINYSYTAGSYLINCSSCGY